MAVLGRNLIFQPVIASLSYTQTRAYNNDTILTLQDILTLQIFHQFFFKKRKRDTSNFFGYVIKIEHATR